MSTPDRQQKAKTFYEASQFAEAGAIYHELWVEQGDAFSGTRYTHCLRKAGHANAALSIARQVAQKHPNDTYACRELVWALYEAQFKPAKERGDLRALTQAAQEIANLTDETLPMHLVTFAVIDLAKDKGQWQLVSYWCDRLDPQTLNLDKREVGDQRILSEREQWYFAKVKALVQLNQWAEARRWALEAQQTFPRNIHFQRWAAQALAGEGDRAGAIQELEVLLARGASDWFILADLAQLWFELGQLEEALRAACRAALAFGEDKAKVNLFVLLAQINLALGQVQAAAYHLALTKAVRQRENWPIKNDLIQLEQQIATALATQPAPDMPTDPTQLFKICQAEWRKQVMAGRTRYTGQVCNLPESKKFGFIAPDQGGENIFVFLRDLPRPAQKVGARVEFSLETSFDQKKNKESVRAVNVQVLK